MSQLKPKMVLNRRCMYDDMYNSNIMLRNCTNYNDIILESTPIDSGAGGVIYKAKTKDMITPMIVKQIVNEVPKEEETKYYDRMNKEIVYTDLMSKWALGPILYDAFHIIMDTATIRGNKTIIQFILMEYFDYNGEKVIKLLENNPIQLTSVIEQMIMLIKQMILEHNLYCVDIKPKNFVAKKLPNGNYVVKIIDFGYSWCKPHKLQTDTPRELYQMLIFQLFYLILATINQDAAKTINIGQIFCKEFDDNFPQLIDKYADNKYLTFNYYVNLPNETRKETCKMIYQMTGVNLTPFAGIATNEIFLIRAESLARMGELNNALTTINTLLAKRWKTGTYIPLTAANADEALQKIITERSKELPFTGNLVWEDLRRLNTDQRFARTLKKTVNGTTYVLPPNDSKYVMPIPDVEIRLTGIPQNPRL